MCVCMYVECVIDEFLNCSLYSYRMVEHRVKLARFTGFWRMVAQMPCVSWRGEWQILSTTVVVFGGISVIISR